MRLPFDGAQSSLGYALVRAFGGDQVVALSMLSKSLTTPIAIRVAQSVGGDPSLTAILAILSGILQQNQGRCTRNLCIGLSALIENRRHYLGLRPRLLCAAPLALGTPCMILL